MYEHITLKDIKNWMNINSADDDSILDLLRPAVKDMVERYTSHMFVSRVATEYYNGDKTRGLLVHQYPIYSITTLHDDTGHDYASGDLISSDDYRIFYDVGKVELTNDETSFARGQQNIKIVYWHGYSRFHVVDEANNYIDITDSGGTAAVEFAARSVEQNTIYLGYTAEELASTLQTALNADATLAGTFTVTYNHQTQKFTIASDTNFTILWSTGASKSKSCGLLMGFNVTEDDAPASTKIYTSDDAKTGVPEDIQVANLEIIHFLYEQSKQGKGYLTHKRVSMPHGEGDMSLMKDIPDEAKRVLDNYRRVYR